MKDKISLLFCSTNNISSRFTLFPFWVSKQKGKFDFFDNKDILLRKDINRTLVVFSKYFRTIDVVERAEFLVVARKKYQKLIFFEDNAGSESEFLGYLPYFDLYFKKQLFKDRSLYTKELYGNKIFTEYYFQEYGVNMDPIPETYSKQIPLEELSKLRLGWNLGLGQYLRKNKLNRPDYFPKIYKYLGPWFIKYIMDEFPRDIECPNPSLSLCQARFDYQEKRSAIDFQRKLYLELINGNPLFVTGRIPKKEYNREIKEMKAVLSPFGFGEICFRDFEAIFNGSVLIKPDMSHIETWPNIYQSHITYLPVSWDGTDLISTVENLLMDQEKLNLLKNNAWDYLKSSYLSMEDRLSSFVIEIESL
jgi:hypothetical protein